MLSQGFNRRGFFFRSASSAAALFAGGLFGRAWAAVTPSSIGAITSYRPEDDGFSDKRDSLIWQAIKPDRKPLAIFEVGSEQDIAAILAEARKTRRRVAIVSGGHSYVGNGIRDDALLLDLSLFQNVRIDALARRAEVQPGLRCFDFDAALSDQGLAFPVAHNPTVGLGGYLLGGGMGWNSESWNNIACFNTVAVEAILASGERILADEKSHPDLFWAARGGGPNFPGVVTGFHLQLFPRPHAIRESSYVYPIAALGAVTEWLGRVHVDQAPNLELTLILENGAAENPAAPPEWQCIVSAVYFADSEAEARAIHEKVVRTRPSDEPLFKEELTPRTIADLLLADKASVAIRHCVETMWTNEPKRAAQLAAARLASSPSPTTLVYVNFRANPKLPGDAAYSRMAKAFMFVDASWKDASADAANRKWVDSLIADLSADDAGSYINETEFVRNPARATDAFTPHSLARLKAIAARYDPDGMFVSPINP